MPQVDALIQSGVLRPSGGLQGAETPLALPPLIGPRHHRPSTRRVLRRRTQRVLPHSAFRGQTPDEMYFGTGDAVPADLMSRAAAARRTRVEANRSASCETCPSVDAAA